MSRSLKTLLRKSTKPAAMALVAGSLSLSLVVTTPSNAQAFVPPPVLPVVAGAAEVATGVAAITPVGWAVLGATALGVGLYATKDYWLPWVKGMLGAADNQGQSGAPNNSWTWHTIKDEPFLNADKKTLTVNYIGEKKSTDAQAEYGVIGHCLDPATGKTGYRKTTASRYISSGGSPAFTYNAVPCPFGQELTGWIAGGGQGSALGQYTPNLDLSDPQPVQMQGTNSIYDFASSNYYKGGDMGKVGFGPTSPDMKYRVEVECIADDGTKSTISQITTGDKKGITFPSCAAAGKGHGTGNIKVFATPPGTTTEQAAPIWTATPNAPDPNAPLCDSTRPGSGCKLQILIDGQPCTMGLFACEHWSDLKNDPNWSSRLSCQQGPYQMPFSTCNPLERAYEPGGAPTTEKNTDGDPNTRDDTQPDGTTAPKTGPGTGTTPGTVPGGQGAPAPGPAPADSPDAKSRECFPSGWGVFNPLEWVLKPIRCAFEPSQQAQSDVQKIPANFNTRAPFTWMAGAGVVVSGAAAVPSSGCPNWVVHVGGYAKNVVCDSTFTAALVASRPSILGLLILVMFWPLIRSLWYAVIPIIRPTPMA